MEGVCETKDSDHLKLFRFYHVDQQLPISPRKSSGFHVLYAGAV